MWLLHTDLCDFRRSMCNFNVAATRLHVWSPQWHVVRLSVSGVSCLILKVHEYNVLLGCGGFLTHTHTCMVMVWTWRLHDGFVLMWNCTIQMWGFVTQTCMYCTVWTWWLCVTHKLLLLCIICILRTQYNGVVLKICWMYYCCLQTLDLNKNGETMSGHYRCTTTLISCHWNLCAIKLSASRKLWVKFCLMEITAYITRIADAEMTHIKNRKRIQVFAKASDFPWGFKWAVRSQKLVSTTKV